MYHWKGGRFRTLETFFGFLDAADFRFAGGVYKGFRPLGPVSEP